MRLAILADIHGNLPALEAVLRDAEQHAIDEIVVAGDLVTRGPHPNEVMRLLRTRHSRMIRGNGDDDLLEYDTGDDSDARHTSAQWATLRWSYRHIGREALSYLASLPEQCILSFDGTAPIRVVHGSLASPLGVVYPDSGPERMRLSKRALRFPKGYVLSAQAALAQIVEPVLVCGHTHVPWATEHDGRLAINPGSVGSPINGDPRAQYALCEWRGGKWQVTHRAVSYDLALIRAEYEASGLLEEGGALARAFLLTVETGRNIILHLFSHIRALAAEAGHEGYAIVPDDIWKHAVATFDWQAVAEGGKTV